MDVIRNGKITIKGIEFDSPLEEPFPRKQFREWKEGARTTFRSIWIDSYVTIDKAICRESYELKITNRGKSFLDDIELKGDDSVAAKYIFENLKLTP